MKTPIAHAEIVRLTYSLRHPDDWARAIADLKDRSDPAVVEGLIELVHRPPTAQAALAALEALETCESRTVLNALLHSLDSPHVYVRLAAIRSLQKRHAIEFAPRISRMLDRDPAWLIRRAAVEFLACDDAHRRWDILKASTDPHWRVRHALIQVLLTWCETLEDRNEIAARLTEAGTDARTRSLLKYLEFRRNQQPPEPLSTEETDPAAWCEFWDWDPAVLAWRFEQMSPAQRREAISMMPRLVGHEDERVRRWAAIPLKRDGEVPELLETLRWLDDPRHPAYETLIKLTEQLDGERIEQLARSVFALERPSPGQWVWAIEHIETTISVEDIPNFNAALQRAAREVPRVRAAFAQMLSRLNLPETQGLLTTLLKDPHPDVILSALQGIAERLERGPFSVELSQEDWQSLLTSDDPEIRRAATAVVLHQTEATTFLSRLATDPLASVRALVAEWLVKQNHSFHQQWLPKLQQDESSLVRAAALTGSRAEELIQNPASETSWLVLEHAARLGKTPLWNIAPEPLLPEPESLPEKPAWLAVQQNATLPKRRLADWDVTPLGISGHYGLPVEGFARAMEAGINLMFWEPNYQTLTNFMGRLPARERGEIRLVVGTFEANPSRIRRDVERALDKLQIEQIAVFLLFWTRSWNRITDAVRDTLDQLRQAGKIGTYGLSTHSRPLAVEAMESGWNPVMVRHSAAHRGAETAIFPKALEHGTQLLTFNNTCYGRLLEAFPAEGDLSPADCYRYTLSFAAVTACWSAPSSLEELETNLSAIQNPELPANRREQLCEVGRQVYQEDTVFRQLVRGV